MSAVEIDAARKVAVEAYDSVVAHLVSTVAEFKGISIEDANDIIAELATIVDPKTTDKPVFVAGILRMEGDEPVIIFPRKKLVRKERLITPPPFTLPLNAWGRLVVSPDLLKTETPPEVPVKGQLRYNKKTGERLFLARFFDLKSKSPTYWPEGFFNGKAKLEITAEGPKVLGQKVDEGKIIFNWKSLPGSRVEGGTLYGRIRGGMFFVQEVRATNSPLPPSVLAKLNRMIDRKNRINALSRSRNMAINYVRTLGTEQKKREDTEKMLSFVQKATGDIEDPNDETAKILKNIIYFGQEQE
jgi:hypothetical protein